MRITKFHRCHYSAARSSIVRLLGVVAAALLLLSSPPARANIYQWAWVNPGDPSQGVYQSTTLCPGGYGVSAVPYANLSGLTLTTAYLVDADLVWATLTNSDLTNANLTGASIYFSTLTNANFTNASLTGANVEQSTVTNANFSNATVAGADFGYTPLTSFQLYSTASYRAQDLHGIGLNGNDLSGWNFAGQNLTGALVECSAVTNANFSNATVAGADFGGTSLTSSQLYTTASYQAKDLHGIGLECDDLTGWNFAGQNLTGAWSYGSTLTNASFANANLAGRNFERSTLTNANFSNATVTGADFGNTSLTSSQLYSTASYQAKDLRGIGLGANDLTGWNFAGQNLTNANISSSTLTNADFSNATVTGADLDNTSLASSQLYSTASYQAKDLHGIGLGYNDLTGWNFAGQNLTGADVSSTLTNANLTGANLQCVDFSGATLSGANLTTADLRGASWKGPGSATTTNTILPNGTILGLRLDSGNPLLVVRNYTLPYSWQGPAPIPIHISQGMSMSPDTTLQFQFDASTWGSTISFDAGIPVTLGGKIELGLAPGIQPSSLAGDTFQLFDWSGVSPSGPFGQIVSDLPTRYLWDTSALYTLGDIQLVTSPINGQWTTNGSGTWSGTANWTSGNVPGVPQDTAVFGTVLTTGTATATLDFSLSLAGLGFSTIGGATYTISPSGASTLTLSSTAGSATISNSGGNHAIAVPVVLGSNLTVSATAGSSLTVSGPITEASPGTSVTLTGSGQLILSASNTYTGGTTISGGTLQLGDGVSNNGSVAGNITDNAHVTFANPNGQTYTGTISGSGGVTKTAAGALVLSASNIYSGDTTVGSGILEVDGSLPAGGNVQVQSGGTLSGSGSVGNVSVAPGAAVAPGSIGGGTLTTASLILSNSSSLNASLGTGNGSDSLLAVAGSLTVGSDLTVNVVPGTNWTAGPYTLATFGSLVDGSNNFSGWTVTGTNLGINFSYDFSSDSHDLYLDVLSVPEPSTFALLGVAAVGLLAFVWRRKRT